MQVTAVYLIGHMGMFYTTHYLLIPRVLHKLNILYFLTGFLFTALVLAGMMFLAMGFVFNPQQLQAFQSSTGAFVIYLLTSNIFVGGLLVGGKAVMDNFKNRRLNEKLKTERLESELHYLKAQVNPHFLFNTINSVYVLITLNPQAAAHTLIKLSELLRAQLYEFSDKEIPIEKEILYLENYIALEKVRKGENIVVEFVKEGSLAGFSIAPLMLLPFLENCFKFVPSGKGTINNVRVKLKFESGVFEAHFYNTKEANYISSGVGGIGLKNIKRRFELIYPRNYELHIQDRESEFIVDLKIQLHG
jgi:LytS/YehU family sensor histidine kinase